MPRSQLSRFALCATILFVVLNAIQAWLSGLHFDEAYHWTWSLHPAWGYYDHPPLVAWLISAGYALIPNELGVRLAFVLLGGLSVFLLFKTNGAKDERLFFVTILSTMIWWVAGFFAMPDNALLPLLCLFFFFFERYLEHDTPWNTAALSLLIPLMFYSKYNSLLVIFFTVLANLHLYRRPSFRVIAAVSIVLSLPHVLWQWNNGFPTATFLWVERFHEPWTPLLFLLFVGGQLLLAGPFIGFITFYTAFKHAPASRFERTLQWNLFGIMGFFLLLVFYGRVEGNWTAPAFIPLLLLSHQYIRREPGVRKWLYYLAVPGIVLMLVVRVNAVHKLFDLRVDRFAEMRGWDVFADTVRSRAHGLPVVAFAYPVAAQLSFQNRTIVPSFDVDQAGSQYRLWHPEDDLQGKDILYISNTRFPHAEELLTPTKRVLYAGVIKSMRSYYCSSVEPMGWPAQSPPSASIVVPVRIVARDGLAIIRNEDSGRRTYASYRIYNNSMPLPLSALTTPLIADTIVDIVQDVRILTPDSVGEYAIEFGLETGGFTWWRGSARKKLVVWEPPHQ